MIMVMTFTIMILVEIMVISPIIYLVENKFRDA